MCKNNINHMPQLVYNNKNSSTTSTGNSAEISPKKVNIILPPKAHSEDSSVNSSRESLALAQSLKLQNENLSFHYDIENFSHIDETENEEEEEQEGVTFVYGNYAISNV